MLLFITTFRPVIIPCGEERKNMLLLMTALARLKSKLWMLIPWKILLEIKNVPTVVIIEPPAIHPLKMLFRINELLVLLKDRSILYVANWVGINTHPSTINPVTGPVRL